LTTTTGVTKIWKCRVFFGKGKVGVPGEKPLGAREITSNKLSRDTYGIDAGI